MIRSVLRPVALVVLVTLLIWLAVVIYWQETQRSVTAEDIALFMVGLPLAAVLGGFALRAGYRYATLQRPDKDVAAPVTSTTAASASATHEGDGDWRIALLALGVACGAGNNGAQAYSALKDGEVRPSLDTEMRDADGLPLRTARIPDLQTEAVEEWLEQRYSGSQAAAPSHLRALALLSQAMQEIVPVLQSLAPDQSTASAKRPRLVVDLQVAEHWDETTRAMAAEYLAGIIDQADWPTELRTVTVVASDEGDAAVKSLNTFGLAASRGEAHDLMLLAACDCALDEDRVEDLQARLLLFSHRNQQGRVPGEAAAAVLARSAAVLPSDEQVVAIARRAAQLPRQKSADAPGRIDHETLAQATQLSLHAAQIDARAICTVVSDADHRSSRTAETAAMMNDTFPDLDPVAQCVRVGDALGHLGAARALVAMAVAAGASQTEQQPVLLVSVSHPIDRAAMVIGPLVSDPAAAAGTA